MYLSVKKVKPLIDYKLELTFENNEIRIFDVKPYLDTGLFRTLKDENLFKMVRVSYDTIEWPNKVDLDPEVLYEKGKVMEKNRPRRRVARGLPTADTAPKTKNKREEDVVYELAGSWKDDRTADEMVADMHSSRMSNEKINIENWTGR
jgi:hypothetical protein